jgi:protein-export membrane protein SecD
MLKHRLISLFLVVALLGVGFFVYKSEVLKFDQSSSLSKYAFKLGLDLNGGTELIYKADTSSLNASDISSAMDTLRDVIERRVNVFGVSEPVIYTEKAGFLSGQNDERLVVELPGVTNVNEAIKMIGQTPKLEFMLVRPEARGLTQEELALKTVDQVFMSTGLDGRFLEKSSLEFTSQSSGVAGKPIVSLSFNKEGKDLFAKITKENKGQVLAIFLDGNVISAPVINEEIKDGKAVIQGSFTAKEGKDLVRNLNYGALPLPISLLTTETIGPSLGDNAKKAGVKAGELGFILIVIFLIVYYRLPGLIASISLAMYIVLSLAIFKLVPVTLTSAGIAGFILSIGMAVDANILIFERLKEELKKGNNISTSMQLGFKRAWLSIRDSNISSIITALVLFWLGSSAVKGFALTLGIGVLISMLTAIVVSRTFLFAVSPQSKDGNDSKLNKFLFSNGLHF